MGVAVPPTQVEAFAINGAKNAIPVESQIPITAGAASLNDGFPPLTMTDPTSGGVPPSGLDMNGILYLISAWTAWLSNGGQAFFQQDFIDEGGAYNVGVILQSQADPSIFYLNTLADNVNDPDVDQTGWVAYSPITAPTGLQQTALAAGQNDNLALAPGIGFLDLDTSAGAASLTSIEAGFDGQIIIVTCTGVPNLECKTMDPAADPGNALRLALDTTLITNSNISLRYSSELALWVQLS